MHNTLVHTIKITLAACALFLFIGALASLGGLSADPARAAADDNVSGWAWSDNIGWISFKGENYGVNVDDNSASQTYGAFSGFAWSDAIGWIDFSPDASGAPEEPLQSASANLATGIVTGWARACSVLSSSDCSGTEMKSDTARGGWDGWIKMSGVSPNYSVTLNSATKKFEGFAWGGDPVGWISMSGASPSYAVVYGGTPGVLPTSDAPSVSLEAPASVADGTNADINWTVRNAAENCTGTDTNPSDATTDWWADRGGALDEGGNGGGPGVTIPVGPITAPVRYTLTCGGASAFVDINVNPFIKSFVACNSASCSGTAITILNGGMVEFRWDTANYDSSDSCTLNGIPVDAVCVSGGAEIPCTSEETITLPEDEQYQQYPYTLSCLRGAPPKTVQVNVRDQDFILQANPVDIKITSIGDIERGTGGVSSKAKITAIANIQRPITLSVINDPFIGYDHSYHFQLVPLEGEDPVPGEIIGSGVLSDARYLVGIEFWIETGEPLPALSDTSITIKGDPSTPTSPGDDRTVEIHLNSRLFDPEYKEF